MKNSRCIESRILLLFPFLFYTERKNEEGRKGVKDHEEGKNGDTIYQYTVIVQCTGHILIGCIREIIKAQTC